MSTNTMTKLISDVRYILSPSMCGPETVYDDAALKNSNFRYGDFSVRFKIANRQQKMCVSHLCGSHSLLNLVLYPITNTVS
jgi:hypothetical protein